MMLILLPPPLLILLLLIYTYLLHAQHRICERGEEEKDTKKDLTLFPLQLNYLLLCTYLRRLFTPIPDYWKEFQDGYDSLKEKEKRYEKEYVALERAYKAVKEKFVEGMNRYDEHLQKAFTIKIGSTEIKPPLKQLRVDDEGEIVYVNDGSGSGEEGDEEKRMPRIWRHKMQSAEKD